MRNLYYILLLVFLYGISGGIEEIAFRVENDIEYLLDMYYTLIEYFFISEPVG